PRLRERPAHETALPRPRPAPDRRARPLRAAAPSERAVQPQAPAVQRIHAEAPARLPHVPRRAWVAAGAALFAWQAAAGRPGVGLVWLAAIAPLVLLAGSRRATRPATSGLALLPALLAPALGALRLAGAFPAMAGQARRWPARGALGAVGYWWLALAEP